MDTQVVVKEQLSTEMIDAGRELIKQLAAIKFHVDAALWLYLADNNTWRFVIANPEVGSHGPKRAYSQVQLASSRIAQDVPQIGLREITVVDSSDPLISLMRKAIPSANAQDGVRLSHSMIHGTLVEDAYLYKIQQRWSEANTAQRLVIA